MMSHPSQPIMTQEGGRGVELRDAEEDGGETLSEPWSSCAALREEESDPVR